MTSNYIFLNGCDGGSIEGSPDYNEDSFLTYEEANKRVVELAERNPGVLVSSNKIVEEFSVQYVDGKYYNRFGTEIPPSTIKDLTQD